MNLKKIITTLSFLILLSCGYESIYSNKQINNNYNLSINTINYTGNNKVSQILRYAKIIFLGRLQSYIPITAHIFFRSPLL